MSRSEARDAYRGYRSTYDIAGHYQREVLPLRKIISDEMLLRYNAMQIDVFALLTEARQRIAASTAAIDASAISGSPASICRTAIIGGGAERRPTPHERDDAAAPKRRRPLNATRRAP